MGTALKKLNVQNVPRLFGTDGIRGIANEHPMLPEVALRIGQGLVQSLLQENPQRANKRLQILIGKDTRTANYMIEQALTAGLCSIGADVLLVGPMPTPAVSFLIKSMRADAGIVITASHNPHEYTGIKVFNADGDKISDELERMVEEFVSRGDSVPFKRGKIGKAHRVDDASGRYIVQLKNHFPVHLSLEGLRIVLDCAHGAAYRVGPKIFEELGAEVISAGVNPRGDNINEKVGANHPEMISSLVKKYRANIGLSLDGDGDRLLVSDENGQIVDGNALIGILALDLKSQGKLNANTVVSSIMCNSGLKETLYRNDIKLTEVPVGDRNVFEELQRNNLSLGGEPSGHIIVPELGSTSDGIAVALRILEILGRTKATLSDLLAKVSIYPSISENIKVKNKVPLGELKELQRVLREIRVQQGQFGKTIVRYSGTEPLLRVYIDGKSQEEIDGISQIIFRALRSDGVL